MSAHHPSQPVSIWRRLGGMPAPGAVPDAQAMIAAFPGPAMLLTADARVIAANTQAERLVRALERGLAEDVKTLTASVAATLRPATGQIFLPAESNGEDSALYALTALPLAGQQVTLMAHDNSAEYAMRQALIESRELYRDLARCSSDFSWQTDENGVFSFVSPRGALGFSAKALNGRSSLSLMQQGDDGTAPFITRQTVENAEIQMHGANGDIRHCRVHAVPVYDRANNWRGARGVCTDVTEVLLRQQALDAMRARDDHIRSIVEATQHTLDPDHAFGEVARIIAGAMAVQHCAVLAVDNGDAVRLLGASASTGWPPPEALLNGLCKACAAPDAASENTLDFQDADFFHQAITVAHGGAVNGAIWLRREKSSNPAEVSGLPRSLAQSAANHVGIAIAHANQLRMLNNLSRTDELTGLLNRRAFTQDLQQRHAHRFRVQRPAALLYVDVDNFKPVNDTHGHATGDMVLREIARLLQRESRAGDRAARLGGDEFALWLEDTDENGARIKAQHLLDAVPALRRAVGLAAQDKPIGLSIGVAVVDPKNPEALDQTMQRADAAMYQVKHADKGGFYISGAAMSAPVTTESS